MGGDTRRRRTCERRRGGGRQAKGAPHRRGRPRLNRAGDGHGRSTRAAGQCHGHRARRLIDRGTALEVLPGEAEGEEACVGDERHGR